MEASFVCFPVFVLTCAWFVASDVASIQPAIGFFIESRSLAKDINVMVLVYMVLFGLHILYIVFVLSASSSQDDIWHLSVFSYFFQFYSGENLLDDTECFL